MAVKTDKWGAKTYETGTVTCNKTGTPREYSIVDNGTPTFMLHVADRAFTADTLKGIRAVLKALSEEYDFTVKKDKETVLQHS